MAKAAKEGAVKKAVPTLPKGYKDAPEEGFDPGADAFAGGGVPASDGRHLILFKSPKKGGEVRIVKWEKDGEDQYDFSLRFEGEIVDREDADFGKRFFGDWASFTKTKKGVKTNQVATILAKLGVTPSGRKKQDTDRLLGLLAKGFKLYATSRWICELAYDEKADSEYKFIQKQVPFLKGQQNFPTDSREKAIPLSTVPEETEITTNVWNKKRQESEERTVVFEKGWPLRTFAELIRFEAVDE